MSSYAWGIAEVTPFKTGQNVVIYQITKSNIRHFDTKYLVDVIRHFDSFYPMWNTLYARSNPEKYCIDYNLTYLPTNLGFDILDPRLAHDLAAR